MSEGVHGAFNTAQTTSFGDNGTGLWMGIQGFIFSFLHVRQAGSHVTQVGRLQSLALPIAVVSDVRAV